MRRFFDKKGFYKFLSVVLVMTLLAGVIGVYPMMAQANEETIPEGVFKTSELGSIAASYNLTAEQTIGGVKITYPSESANAFSRVGTKGYYMLDEYGIHVDVTDISYATSDEYSFAMYFGNVSNALYDQDGYMIVYEKGGVLSVIASGIKSSPKGAPKVVGPVEVDPLDGDFSVDIKLVDSNYVLNINGYTYTIAAQYEADTTQAIQDTSKAYLSFAFLDDGLMDSTSNYAAIFNGATYTIKTIGYNVGGVTVDSTRNMVVNQTTSLTANVYPENVSNKAVTWKSSDESIATVDDVGNVTAVAEGNVTITVTSVADATKSATCQIKVGSQSIKLEDFSTVLSGITAVDTDDASGVQMTASTTGAGWERIHTNTTYSVEDGVCIDIDAISAKETKYSLVVAIGNKPNQWYDQPGYMLLCDGNGNIAVVQSPLSGSSPISVSAVSAATIDELGTGLSILIKKSGEDYKITVNGTELIIENAVSVLGSGGAHYLAFGVMSDFTLTGETISGLNYTGSGETIGRTDSVSFVIRSISALVSGVSVNTDYVNMFAEETVTLSATASPSTASQSVRWNSADETIATVNNDGTVTALKAGTTVITVTSKSDESKMASCVVKVTKPSEYMKLENFGGTSKPAVTDVEGGVKVHYTAETDAWRRLETKYDSVTENNYPLKYNGFWPEGNGVHIGFKDIELTNDTDTLAIFVGKRDYSTYTSSWYDTPGGAYMIFYGKDGSFAIVETYQSWSNNYIEKVLVSEKREVLAERLSLDVREEDGRYELLVNGKAYSVPAEGDECPIPRTSSTDRLHFAFGLMIGFNVSEAGVMTGPNIKNATKYSSNGTFTITDISYITTEELATADYVQRTSVMNLDGNYVIGKNELATTTTFGIADFNGTLDDSREDLVWEIATVDNGYSVKVADGDENSYLNISSTGVSLGAMQVLEIEHVSNTTTSYFTVSDGTNYVNIAGSGVTSSTSADRLILYNVRPELAEATTEKPLFTLSTFADLHSERKYTNGTEEYIRDGIVEATQKVREQENANVIAFLGDLISNKSYDADNNKGFWLGTGEDIEEQWTTARDKMYEAAMSATESGRALFLTGNHDYAIGSLDTSNIFNSGDYTSGIESKLPELTDENAYFQSEWPEGTPDEIKNAGHVLAYHYNIDGMDLISINTTYTGTEITSGWNYDAEALDWMGSKLESIGKDKTVIVLGHYPTSSLKTGDEAAYEKITGIFEQYPNVIYLYGHNHNPYIHTDTYQRVQTYAADGTVFQNRYETPTGYIEAFAGSVAFTNDVGLDSTEITGTPAVVQGLIVKVYNDRIVLQMKNYGEAPLGVENLREYTIMRDVELNVDENPQAAKTVEYTTAFPNFRAGEEMEAPIAPVGYVFAGWYYDEACTSLPVASATKVLAEGTKVYAKFVPEIVLSVNAQTRYTTEGETNKIDLRLVTTVDSWDYREVGFIVTNRAGVPKIYPQQYVFASLLAAGYTKTPREINECSIRFGTINIIGITVSGEGVDPNREIPVQAYWITKDGTTVYGPARTIKVSDAVAILENMN